MNRTVAYHRIAASIENGNIRRFTRWNAAQCEQVAREALEATGWKSLKAAYRYLDSKRIAHD